MIKKIVIAGAGTMGYSMASIFARYDYEVVIYDVSEKAINNAKEKISINVDTLVNESIMDEYRGGTALVFRLSTDNYHRYCYIDSGSKGLNHHIKGVLHTVQPISLNHYNFYTMNDREYTVLNTNNFGKVIQVEIGALVIGKIHNNHETYIYKKGEEKGYFEFGGSTIVVLVKKNTINLDKDILENSLEDIETIVKYGERIGTNTFITKIKSTIQSIIK